MDFEEKVNDLNSNGLEKSKVINNIYGEEDVKEGPYNDNEEIGEEPLDEKPMESDKTFYKEVIEKKPKKWGKMVLVMMFVLGLTLGTVLEYVADNFIGYLRGQNVIYAAEGQKYNYIIDKTVSPVVPIAKKVSPSIVAIKIKKAYRDWFGGQYESEGTGSGIIIDAEGHIVTNNHVVEDSNDYCGVK